jgi:hypothetical protein
MKHFIVPDTQVRPGDSTDHLTWAAKYCVSKKPEVIIFLGDHWDMPSLCTYDYGTKGYEGRAYKQDIKAGNEAMLKFMIPIWAEQGRQRKNKEKIWKPRMVFIMGNHEDRIQKAVNADRKLEGLMTETDFNLVELGFEVYPFLQVVVIDGVAYSHFFTSGVMGRPCSNARLMLNKKHMSCVMGHVQDRDIAFAKRADGTRMTGLFAGVFYQEDQEYLNPQTNDSWVGCWMLNEVKDGAFDELPLSLGYLRDRCVR